MSEREKTIWQMFPHLISSSLIVLMRSIASLSVRIGVNVDFKEIGSFARILERVSRV